MNSRIQTGGRQPDQAAPFSESLVDGNSEFNGRYHSNTNLRIDGKAQGEISCTGMLVISENARVEARIQAQNVTIAGQYRGEVDCSGRFVLLPSARAGGQVKTGSLVIQEGAVFNGEIRMTDSAAKAHGEPRSNGSKAEAAPGAEAAAALLEGSKPGAKAAGAGADKARPTETKSASRTGTRAGE